MNIYPGLWVKNKFTDREYKVTDVSRHFISPGLFVVFERTIGGTRESRCVSEDYFNKNFEVINKPFFQR